MVVDWVADCVAIGTTVSLYTCTDSVGLTVSEIDDRGEQLSAAAAVEKSKDYSILVPVASYSVIVLLYDTEMMGATLVKLSSCLPGPAAMRQLAFEKTRLVAYHTSSVS